MPRALDGQPSLICTDRDLADVLIVTAGHRNILQRGQSVGVSGAKYLGPQPVDLRKFSVGSSGVAERVVAGGDVVDRVQGEGMGWAVDHPAAFVHAAFEADCELLVAVSPDGGGEVAQRGQGFGV